MTRRVSSKGIAKYLSSGGDYRVDVKGEKENTFIVRGYGPRVKVPLLGIPLWRSTYDVASVLFVPKGRFNESHVNLSFLNGYDGDRDRVIERVERVGKKLRLEVHVNG